MSIAAGTGSIVSTPQDVNRFMNALFTGELISTENLVLMKTIKDNYGMGISRYKINDRQGYGHRGRIDGFRSTSIYFPDEKLTFTLTSNASKIDINNIYSEILNLYFDDEIIEISEAEVKKFAGVYFSQKDSSDKVVFTKNKNVLILIIKNEYKEPLVYKGGNRFLFEQMYAESISFTFSSDGKELTFEQGDYEGKFMKK
jgi:D-alanyl-D-alanine carboxypeptidase